MQRRIQALSVAVVFACALFAANLAFASVGMWTVRDVNQTVATRVGQTMVPYGNGIFIWGGTGLGGQAGAYWNRTTGSWATPSFSNTPPARYLHASTVDPTTGDLWIYGGRSTSDGQALSDVWKCDLDTNTWTMVSAGGGASSTQIGPRAGSVAYWDTVNDTLAVFGGWDPSGPTTFSDLWRYDAPSGLWVRITNGASNAAPTVVTPNGVFHASNQPGARFIVSGCMDPASRRVYIFGGRNSSGTHYLDLWCFDMTLVQWAKMGTIQAPPVNNGMMMAPEIANNSLYFTGGLNAPVVYEYNLTTQMLSPMNTIGSPPQPRDYTKLTVNSDRLLLHAGLNGGAVTLNDTWELTFIKPPTLGSPTFTALYSASNGTVVGSIPSTTTGLAPVTLSKVGGSTAFSVAVNGVVTVSDATALGAPGTVHTVNVQGTNEGGFTNGTVTIIVGNAGVGADVQVVTGGVTLVFDQIDSPGLVSVETTTVRQNGGGTPVAGSYYAIHSTAGHSGQVRVVLPYNPANVPAADRARLRMYHFTGGTAVDITDSVDTDANTVTGYTTSFSDFWTELPPGSGNLTHVPARPPVWAWSLALVALLGVGALRVRSKFTAEKPAQEVTR